MRIFAASILVALVACAGVGCGSASDDDAVVATATRPDRTTSERDDDDADPVIEQPAVEDGGSSPPVAAEQPDQARPGTLLSASARRAFAALAAQHGALGAALTPVGSDREPETVGSLQAAVAWSTVKVPIAAAVINRGATPADRRDMRAALTVSDNAAALRLWQRLGGGTGAASAVEQVLRTAGDDTTRVESRELRSGFTPFGQTSWALTDQARFLAGFACVEDADELLVLMREVSPSQRWGLGTIDASAALKGGWGPGSQPGVPGGYLDRQMGIVTLGGRSLAVAIVARPTQGSHEAGIAALDAIASWIEQSVDTDAITAAATRC